MKCYLTAVVTLAAALSWCTPGFAQNYPAKPVRLIVPYGAGGPNDVLGRLLAQKLGELWGQQMVVENRPGAGANIGMSAAAKSAPDGYTLMIAGSSAITVNPSLYRSMPLDPAKDLAPIIRFASAPMVMTVSADSPASTLAEFIALQEGSRAISTSAPWARVQGRRSRPSCSSSSRGWRWSTSPIDRCPSATLP